MHPLEESDQSRLVEPCTLVIFGATGDLTARKLIPALYNLLHDGQLPSLFACIGFARRPKNDAQFRDEMAKAIGDFSRTKPIEASLLKHFQDHLFYHQAEFHEDPGYLALKKRLDALDSRLGTKGNRIFYLATPASYFPLICQKLHTNGLIYKEPSNKWSRVVIEKPFGHDLASAEALQKELLSYLSENQIFRIDHYLGKETVQNLLVFRFGNSLFESLWSKNYIDHIQITVAEEIGIGTRGKFWEETGLVRDIVQNHLMQLLSLVTMEPPKSLQAAAIHDEKVKVLKKCRYEAYVCGQYGPGLVGGKEVIGYRQEKDVAPTSCVETYMALELFIDNERWKGVPFFLRAGKRLPKRTTEIAIIFKSPSQSLFNHIPNVLAIQIQPDEGASLKIDCKVPGPINQIQPVKMDFRYGSYFGLAPPEAYERLICDCMLGDSTLFAREDEVMQSWRLLNPIVTAKKEIELYPAGSWGPIAADTLIEKSGRKWRLL
jgi:glucose-6-phosphate 1-dehydrogenase